MKKNHFRLTCVAQKRLCLSSLFPALYTGHFNKYERKCEWLEYIILLISSVVVKVQCLREKGKTVMPSRKLQAKGEREGDKSASLLVSSDSLAKGETFTMVYPSDWQKTPI